MEKSDALDWHLLSWLVGLVSITGRIVPDRKPVSMLIIGAPGAGKTANLNRFKDHNINRHLQFVTNATTLGLQGILKEKVNRGVTHIVIPEFQTLLLKRSGVWDTMLGTLLPAMEEGVGDVFVGPKQISFGGVRIGMIAAMPTDAFYFHAGALRESGLLSRMLQVRYDRPSHSTMEARHRLTNGDMSELSKVVVDLPKEITVAVPAKLGHLINEYAGSVDADNIHREANRFQALTQAVAWTSGHDVADVDDFMALLQCEFLWKGI